MYKLTTIVTVLVAAFLAAGCSATGSSKNSNAANPSSELGAVTSNGELSPSRELSDVASTNGEYKSSPGFYLPNDAKIPTRVREAQHSVFQIRVLMASSNDAIGQYDVSNGRGAELKRKYASLPDSTFDKFEKAVILKEIERCENYKTIADQQDCAVIIQMAKGTAFLAGSSDTLWTNFHNVAHYLDLVEKFGGVNKVDQLKKNLKIAVYVFDSAGNLVVDPSVTDVHISVVPDLTPRAKSKNSLYAEDSDYVALKVSKSIGVPLQLAHRIPIAGEPVYHLGYPACTGCSAEKFQTSTPEDFADRSPFPNSDGVHLFVSVGNMVSTAAAKSFLGISDAVASEFNLASMLFSSAESVGGNSGSPILDKNGFVLGIDAGGKTEMKNGHYERLARGVLPKEFTSGLMK